MFLHKTPAVIRFLYPGITWRIKTSQKIIYLTFDDGPVPVLTPWILSTLEKYKAKATFFCVGHNIEKHTRLFSQLVSAGHKIGNHTYNHMNGWQTAPDEYLANTHKTKTLLEKLGVKTDLFRPPYGKLTRRQRKSLEDYRIVMWDVLSGDFSQKLSKEHVLGKSLKYSGNGSIVVFHDNTKASPRLRFVLPRYLEYFTQKGFVFKAL